MAERGDAHFLEVVGSEAGQHLGIDVIVAECRLVTLKAEASQPVSNVHCRSLARSGHWSPAEHAFVNPDVSRTGDR